MAGNNRLLTFEECAKITDKIAYSDYERMFKALAKAQDAKTRAGTLQEIYHWLTTQRNEIVSDTKTREALIGYYIKPEDLDMLAKGEMPEEG